MTSRHALMTARHANLPRHDAADRPTRIERSLAHVDRLELVIRCVEFGLPHRGQTDQQLREALARRICQPLRDAQDLATARVLTQA